LITLIAHARTRNSEGVVAFAGKGTFQKDQLLETDPGARLGNPSRRDPKGIVAFAGD
jgi:hypothetical protein